MTDIPSDRLQEGHPFSYCEVDISSPSHIKKHQSTLKTHSYWL